MEFSVIETNKAILGAAAMISAAIYFGLVGQAPNYLAMAGGGGGPSLYVVNAQTGAVSTVCGAASCMAPTN